MSNYTKTTDFQAKDSLPTGDSGKIIRGSEFETEFDAISTAIATKADTAGPTFTGTLTFETISDGTINVTAFVDEDDMTSNSATLVPTQQSVKAYVDAVTTELNAQDLDFQADSGGALSIDLDTETMTFTGGTGIDTSGSGNAVTFAIDSTVATLTGTQTLTNKTLTSPDINTPDIDGGTIDGATIATSDITVGTGKTLDVSSGTLTLADNQISGDKVEGGTIASTTITSLASTTVDTTNLEVTNIKAKDGTSAGSIADSTGVVTLASSVLTTTDINSGTIDGTTIGGSTAAAGSFTTVSATGNITVGGTVDGRDVATDGTKLDTVETNADVTDTANVTAAGAVMDSELTSEASVKALNQGVATTDSPTFAGLTTTADVSFGDNDKAIFGAGSDLQIYHSGSHSFINDAGTGNLYIKATNGVLIQDFSTGTNRLTTSTDGSINLYHNNNLKLATTSTGIDVTGTASTDGLTVAGTAFIQSTTTPQLEIAYNSANITGFYRSGGDFQIKNDNGAGTPETSIVLAEDGAVSLYHDASAKLATTSTGIDVTGTVVSDGLTVSDSQAGGVTAQIQNSNATQTGGTRLDFLYSGSTVTGRIQNRFNGSDFQTDWYTGNHGLEIFTDLSKTEKRLDISSGGDVSFFEDTGTTAKLFWDSSAESLGIGTSSPAQTLHLKSADPVIRLEDSSPDGVYAQIDGAGGGLILSADGGNGSASSFIGFRVDGTASGSEKMRIDSSGNVGIGTDSPATTLEVKSNATNDFITLQHTSGPKSYIGNSSVGSLVLSADEGNSGSTSRIEMKVDGTERMRIDSSGRVGIGTSSPADSLEVAGDVASAHRIRINNANASGSEALAFTQGSTFKSWVEFNNSTSNFDVWQYTNNALRFGTNNLERMRITSTGDVEIKSGGELIANRADNARNIKLFNDNDFGTIQTSNDPIKIASQVYTRFDVGGTESMRISAGNLLVSKTSNDNSTAGVVLRDTGEGSFVASGQRSGLFNRLSTDGEIINFRKDGTTAGAIAVKDDTSNPYIVVGKGSVGLQFAKDAANTESILPCRVDNQNLRDNAISLGDTGARFDDIYATNGTIQTSDRNEKQDIEALSDAEQRVAVACKGLLRKFRWKSSVADKGNEARIHFGIIAQDLQDAFTAEGLDAGRYAMFINSTWTDEETGEERSRMGVRYSELLAFIIAAI